MEALPPRAAHGQSMPSLGHRRQASSEHSALPFETDSGYASFAEPPAKLRKGHAHVDKSKGISTGSHNGAHIESTYQSQSADDVAGIAYPSHQARVHPADLTPAQAPPRESLKNGLCRPGIPISPTEAPRHLAGLSDYFPWKRKHQEDALSADVTRAGYFVKPSNSAIETSSARPSITSCIKNKAACESLSDLIVASFQRRQQLCSVTAKNTFKPPPRVTLTDNKREAWLKDLADSAIPLRRLSRTIPHGIRGTSLLDHCLAKYVPTWRAIWLVKCVGSNELRAFRRKATISQPFGGGGEVKWLKDWTDGVLDFIEGLAKVPHPEQLEGRKQVTYALSIVNEVYSEHLIDQDAFNQSLARRLENIPPTNTNACCLWLSVVRQYLTDVLKSCPRGCELVKCLLSKLETAESASAAKSKPVVVQQKCRQLLVSILTDQPASFILPETWRRSGSMIRSLVPDDNAHLLGVFNDLQRRNSLLCPETQVAATREADADQFIPSELDIYENTPDPELMMSSFRRLASDPPAAVQELIEWSTSYKRLGSASVYLAARVIRLMTKKNNYSCQDDIARLLVASNAHKGQLRMPRLYMLIAELVRSRHFSVSKYLHFLLARGTELLQKSQFAVLAYIPRQALSKEVINLAISLCEPLECTFISNKDEVDFQVTTIQVAIGKCRPTSGLTSEDHAHITALDVGTKSAIAFHLRNDIASKRAEQSYPSPDAQDSMDIDSGSLQARLPATLAAFELLQDFPTLADVLLLFTPTADAQSLVLLALCVKYHQKNFMAMSALHRLVTELLKRYALLYQNGQRDQRLTKCLFDVTRTLANSKQTLSVLEGHIEAMNTESAAVACSPVSDQMLDVIQSEDVRSLGDLESLLQSGSVISETLSGKMLTYLINVLQSAQQDPEQMSNALKLLRRLSETDRASFSSFLAKYVHTVLASKDTDFARKVLPWIVAGELCPLNELIASCLKLSMDPFKKQIAIQMALNILVSLANPPTVELCNCLGHYYTFCMLEREMHEENQDKLTRLTELALQSNAAALASTSGGPDTRAVDRTVQRLLFSGVRHPDAHFEDTLLQLHDAGAPVESILCRIVKLYPEAQDEKSTPRFTPLTLLHKVSHVAAPDNAIACRLLAQIEIKRLEQSCPATEILRQAASTFVAETSVWRHLGSWTSLIRNMSNTFVATLHESVLDEVFKHLRFSDASSEAVVSWPYLDSLVSVAAATGPKLTPPTAQKSFDMVLEMMVELSASLDSICSASTIEPDIRRGAWNTLERSTSILLRLSAIQTHQSHLSNLNQEKMVNFGATLSKIYIHLFSLSVTSSSLSTTLLDILLNIINTLSEEARARCLEQVEAIHDTIPPPLESIIGPLEEKADTRSYFLESPDDISSAMASPADTPRSVPLKANKHFNIDPWEMLQDTTPAAGLNDSCLSLNIFGARKAIL